MVAVPRPQEIYRHFKGNLYQIITTAEHSETGECLVIYQALYGDFKIYARPLEMFTGRVDKDKYPDCKQEFRFELNVSVKPGKQEEAKTPEKPGNPETARTPEHAGTPEPEKTPEKIAPPQTEKENEAPELDPMLLEFLDADSYEAKLNILAALHHRITQDMITTMAVASDVEVDDGELEDRYRQLKTCLLTLEKYECNRLR